MNRKEFIDIVSDKSGFSKKETDTMLRAMISTISDALVEGDSIQFVGFGTFETRTRSARVGINPLTKESLKIPAKRVPAFKAGALLKNAILDHDAKPKSGKKKKK